MTTHDLPTDILDDRQAEALRLVATWNGGTVTRLLSAAATLTVGRGEGADVVIDDTSVSRAHARFVIGDRILVEDLGSSNGTWIDGQKLQPGTAMAVRPGTLVELGSVLVVVRGPDDRQGRRSALADANGIVICDPAMDRVFELVELAARSKLSVVILGETGVGKEIIANRLHADSPRASKPFLKVNCAALVETLLEAELFGYERGAFTGAVQAKAGLIESAHTGTFFLDEIGELPAATQAKLLRVIESGQVTRIGGVKPRLVDVRYVAATNRDLGKMVKSGKFRDDLFFRIDGLSIRIHRYDSERAIGPLAEKFAEQACVEVQRPRLAISDDALRKLLAYPWPGNVRELKNVLARSVVLCRAHTIGPDDIHFESSGGAPGASGGREPSGAGPSAESERERIIAALAQAGGNQTRAAKLLGISRRTLVYRLDELGLPRPRKDDER